MATLAFGFVCAAFLGAGFGFVAAAALALTFLVDFFTNFLAVIVKDLFTEADTFLAVVFVQEGIIGYFDSFNNEKTMERYNPFLLRYLKIIFLDKEWITTLI